MSWGLVAVAGATLVGGVLGSKSASDSADAARDAADVQAQSGRDAIVAQREAAQRGQAFFEPFAGAAERGIEASSFLADPQAQFDFLQNNPLFTNALNLRDRDTAAAAAAGGRLQAGDTGLEFAGNFLQAATPLIDRQRQDVTTLLNLGTNVAGSQANIEQGLGVNVSNLITGVGNVEGSGIIGAQNARNQGTDNLINSLLAGASIFAGTRT